MSADAIEIPQTGAAAAVSVVVPVRNGAATLDEALRSVLAAGAAEVVVVDDGSTDGSAAVAEELGDRRIRVVAGPGRGIAAALNAGLAVARFGYVARCDADDRFTPGRLAAQAAWLAAHPGFVAVSGGYRSMTAHGRPIVLLAGEGDARDVTEELLGGHPVTHFGTWLTRRPALLAVGGARPWFVTAEDLDLQFRLAARGRVWHDPAPVYHYRLHDGSITHSQPEDLRVFYEATAGRFARQRRAGAGDDLEAGAPPEFVAWPGARPVATRAAVQASGQLEGVAWRRLAAGHRGEARALMAQSLALDPLNLRRLASGAKLAWRSLQAGPRRGTGAGVALN